MSLRSISYGRPTVYTNYGADVDVAAPSATVSIAANESLTTNFGGTSAAAPVVSGLAGWILSVDPERTSAEVVDLIVQTGRQSPLITPDENGHHDKYGYGVISPVNIHTVFFPIGGKSPVKVGVIHWQAHHPPLCFLIYFYFIWLDCVGETKMILLLTTMVAAAKTDALVTHLESRSYRQNGKILVVSTDKVFLSRLDNTTSPMKCCPSWVISTKKSVGFKTNMERPASTSLSPSLTEKRALFKEFVLRNG